MRGAAILFRFYTRERDVSKVRAQVEEKYTGTNVEQTRDCAKLLAGGFVYTGASFAALGHSEGAVLGTISPHSTNKGGSVRREKTCR